MTRGTVARSLALAIVVALFGACAGKDGQQARALTDITVAPSMFASATTAAGEASPPSSSPIPPTSSAGLGAAPLPVHCGTERWPVKTLSDPDAVRVDLQPVDTTITDLRALAAPRTLPQSSRIAPTEITTYRLTAHVVAFKIEKDRDVHLVIADPLDANQTMIVEFPDADTCSGAVESAQAPAMHDARARLVAAFGRPSASRFTTISGTVTLTGVGFFDFLHGQTGVAPNGIELHPVLSLEVVGAPTSPTPSAVVPVASATSTATACEPAYPDFCIPPPPPDLDCKDIPQRRFRVLPPDPHRFDGDHNGIGCES